MTADSPTGVETDRDQIEKLLHGDLPWAELRNDVLPDPKDPNRFEVTREILHERVAFDDPILVPLNDHLYAVGTDDGRAVVAKCGHELCALGDNWKTACRVRVREDAEDMRELYPEGMGANPEWDFQLREWFCPSCFTLVDVDAVPVGYPVSVPFEPDVDTFYEDWLGVAPPDRRDGDLVGDGRHDGARSDGPDTRAGIDGPRDEAGSVGADDGARSDGPPAGAGDDADGSAD